MQSIIKLASFAAILFAVVIFLGGFILGDFNPTEWDVVERGRSVAIWFVLYVSSTMMYVAWIENHS